MRADPHPRSAELRLARLLVARELRSRALPAVALLTAAAAWALGWHLQGHGLAAIAELPGPDVLGTRSYALAMLGRGIVVPFAIATIHLVADRIAADHEQGWLAPLAGHGVRRGIYPAAVMAGVLVAVLPVCAAAALSYSVAVATGSDAGVLTAVRGTIRDLPGQAALLVAVAAYATACATLVRRRGGALAVALAGLVVPVAVLAGAERLTGSRPPPPIARVVSAHLPRASIASTPRQLARHVGYTGVMLLLITQSAPLLVARQR